MLKPLLLCCGSIRFHSSLLETVITRVSVLIISNRRVRLLVSCRGELFFPVVPEGFLVFSILLVADRWLGERRPPAAG